MHRHTESSIKRREPGILKLATSYNQLCSQLTSLIDKGEAPVTAVPPKPIQRNSLFKLDVDDDIWQDVGLDDDEATEVSRWLADENVQEGIWVLLEYDHSCEEEHWIIKEQDVLQEWFVEEWKSINHTLLLNGMQLRISIRNYLIDC